MTSNKLKSELEQYASDVDANQLQRFFKTQPGGYGEGDQFIGVRVPKIRLVCSKFRTMPLNEIRSLLASPLHEHRLAAVLLMSMQYKKTKDDTSKRRIYELYLEALNGNYINNWDIVDTSCEHILGAHARDYDSSILFTLARSGKLWHQRAAMVSCFAWLRQKQAGPTIELAELLWPETHDLMQKAVGWMLRELGKYVDESLLIGFLDGHASCMPRTLLRYAIERLSPEQRLYYMQLKANLS